jgi:hypothetical protein
MAIRWRGGAKKTLTEIAIVTSSPNCQHKTHHIPPYIQLKENIRSWVIQSWFIDARGAVYKLREITRRPDCDMYMDFGNSSIKILKCLLRRFTRGIVLIIRCEGELGMEHEYL